MVESLPNCLIAWSAPHLLVEQSEEVKNWAYIPRTSVVHFRLERGDFPYSNVEFESAGACEGLGPWTDYIHGKYVNPLS